MRKPILALIVTLTLLATSALTMLPADAAASPSWGSGQITASTNTSRKVKVSDKKPSNGLSVRVYYKNCNSGTMRNAGVYHSSAFPTYYTIGNGQTICGVWIRHSYLQQWAFVGW